MLSTVRLGAFLVPIYDSLIRNTVLIIQHLNKVRKNCQIQYNRGSGLTHFQNLRERLDDARVFITIQLYDINESDLGLGSSTEWFENRGVFLD
jgi:hypothetical protein